MNAFVSETAVLVCGPLRAFCSLFAALMLAANQGAIAFAGVLCRKRVAANGLRLRQSARKRVCRKRAANLGPRLPQTRRKRVR